MALSLQANLTLVNSMTGETTLTWDELANGRVTGNLIPTGSLVLILPIGVSTSVVQANAIISIVDQNLFGGRPPDVNAQGSMTLNDINLGDVLTVSQPTLLVCIFPLSHDHRFYI